MIFASMFQINKLIMYKNISCHRAMTSYSPLQRNLLTIFKGTFFSSLHNPTEIHRTAWTGGEITILPWINGCSLSRFRCGTAIFVCCRVRRKKGFSSRLSLFPQGSGLNGSVMAVHAVGCGKGHAQSQKSLINDFSPFLYKQYSLLIVRSIQMNKGKSMNQKGKEKESEV